MPVSSHANLTNKFRNLIMGKKKDYSSSVEDNEYRIDKKIRRLEKKLERAKRNRRK